MRMKDNTNPLKQDMGGTKKKKKNKGRDSQGSHETHYVLLVLPANEYFVRFRANAQDPSLLFSSLLFSSLVVFFFSYMDTGWPC